MINVGCNRIYWISEMNITRRILKLKLLTLSEERRKEIKIRKTSSVFIELNLISQKRTKRV